MAIGEGRGAKGEASYTWRGPSCLVEFDVGITKIHFFQIEGALALRASSRMLRVLWLHADFDKHYRDYIVQDNLTCTKNNCCTALRPTTLIMSRKNA